MSHDGTTILQLGQQRETLSQKERAKKEREEGGKEGRKKDRNKKEGRKEAHINYLVS